MSLSFPTETDSHSFAIDRFLQQRELAFRLAQKLALLMALQADLDHDTGVEERFSSTPASVRSTGIWRRIHILLNQLFQLQAGDKIPLIYGNSIYLTFLFAPDHSVALVLSHIFKNADVAVFPMAGFALTVCMGGIAFT